MTMEAALLAMRDIIAANTPAEAAFVYAMKDQEPVRLTILPTAIIGHAISGKTDEWQMKAAGRFRHHWTIGIDIFLGEETLPDYEVEELTRPWFPALGLAIMQNPTLNGTVEPPGNPLLTFETGYLSWFDQTTRKGKSYWGIHAEYTIAQSYTPPPTP